MRKTALIVVLVGLAALVLVAKLRYRGKALPVSADLCDPRVWSHVYQPERLTVLTPCTSVEGRVVAIHKNRDGDAHIELDPDDVAVLNLVNATHRRGHLVVESICDHPSDMDAVKAACAGFDGRIELPLVGDRIRALGVYVTDRDNGWNEIHPVIRIDSLEAQQR